MNPTPLLCAVFTAAIATPQGDPPRRPETGRIEGRVTDALTAPVPLAAVTATVDVIVPAAFNFPTCGKLLSLGFLPFVGWFVGCGFVVVGWFVGRLLGTDTRRGHHGEREQEYEQAEQSERLHRRHGSPPWDLQNSAHDSIRNLTVCQVNGFRAITWVFGQAKKPARSSAHRRHPSAISRSADLVANP